jgi:hypothetical protein
MNSAGWDGARRAPISGANGTPIAGALRGGSMPEQEVIERAKEDAREGKSPSTQAGEFVHEEIEHVKEGKHGARSAKQAIAIGLSKARRAGVKLPPPKAGSESMKRQAERDSAKGQSGESRPSRKRSRATLNALRREGSTAVSHSALSRQAHASARTRSAESRSEAAKKAARTRAAQKRGA